MNRPNTITFSALHASLICPSYNNNIVAVDVKTLQFNIDLLKWRDSTVVAEQNLTPNSFIWYCLFNVAHHTSSVILKFYSFVTEECINLCGNCKWKFRHTRILSCDLMCTSYVLGHMLCPVFYKVCHSVHLNFIKK